MMEENATQGGKDRQESAQRASYEKSMEMRTSEQDSNMTKKQLSGPAILNHDIHWDPNSRTVGQGNYTRNHGTKARGTNPTALFTPKKAPSCLHWYSKGTLQSDM